MKLKYILLGSAAALMTTTTAQAQGGACSAYGAAFSSIGGATCVQIDGRVGMFAGITDGKGGGDSVVTRLTPGLEKSEDKFSYNSNLRLRIDSRTATEYGTLRSFGEFNINDNDSVSYRKAYISIAGLTVGKDSSLFDTNGVGFDYGDTIDGPGRTYTVKYSVPVGDGVSITGAIEQDGKNVDGTDAYAFVGQVDFAVDQFTLSLVGASEANAGPTSSTVGTEKDFRGSAFIAKVSGDITEGVNLRAGLQYGKDSPDYTGGLRQSPQQVDPNDIYVLTDKADLTNFGAQFRLSTQLDETKNIYAGLSYHVQDLALKIDTTARKYKTTDTLGLIGIEWTPADKISAYAEVIYANSEFKQTVGSRTESQKENSLGVAFAVYRSF